MEYGTMVFVVIDLVIFKERQGARRIREEKYGFFSFFYSSAPFLFGLKYNID